jgi:hypothetical protein
MAEERIRPNVRGHATMLLDVFDYINPVELKKSAGSA